MNKVDEILKYFNIKRDEFRFGCENGEKTIEKKEELDNFLDKNLGDLKISKELENINKDDLLVSYDFNSLYPSAQIDLNSTWLKLETVYPF